MSRAKNDSERATVQARCDASGITLDATDEPGNILRDGETLVRSDMACACTPEACDCRTITPGTVDTTGQRVDHADAVDDGDGVIRPDDDRATRSLTSSTGTAPMMGGISLAKARAWLGANRADELQGAADAEYAQQRTIAPGTPSTEIYRDLMAQTIRAANPELADRLERSTPTTDALRVIYSELPDPEKERSDMASIDQEIDTEFARARRRNTYRLSQQYKGESIAVVDARFDALEAERTDAHDDSEDARARARRANATQWASTPKQKAEANARLDDQLAREASSAQFRAGKLEPRTDASAKVPLTGKAPPGESTTTSGRWPQDLGDHMTRQIARQNARQQFMLSRWWCTSDEERRQLQNKWALEDLADSGDFSPDAA